MMALAGGGGEAHTPPESIFGLLWRSLDKTYAGGNNWFTWMGFDTHDRHLGMLWFEAICFAMVACAILGICSYLATRNYSRIPRGIQNVMETAVDLLRQLVLSMGGPQGEKYLPYLGSLFLFILTMNLLGLIPGFRSPTMTLSTTAALGFTTFFVVQGIAIKTNGIKGYLGHFCGDLVYIAPLMFLVHLIGEVAKPISLSLRLYGNIFGEDTAIETFIELGGGFPLQFPILLFAVFTSFLQAFIFTTLSSIYISVMTTHEDHEESHS